MQKKRVGIYIRVSSSEQRADLQRNEILTYVNSRGWTVAKTYEDVGTGTNDKRPMLQEMLRDVRARRIDIVISWSLDRLFRSTKHMLVTCQEFIDMGVEYIALKNGVDFSTASGRFMVQILSAFSELEVSILRERTKAGMAAAKKRGSIIGRPPLKLSEAVLSLHSQGLTSRRIAQALEISKTSVLRIIKAGPKGGMKIE